MSAGTIVMLAAGVLLTVITGVTVATQNQDLAFRQAAMAAELEDAARYATVDYILTGNLDQTLANTTAAWGQYNDSTAPELGAVLLTGSGIQYTGDGVCWHLSFTEHPNRVLRHQIVPCTGQEIVTEIDVSGAETG